eukprot:Rmarinus@m.27230
MEEGFWVAFLLWIPTVVAFQMQELMPPLVFPRNTREATWFAVNGKHSDRAYILDIYGDKNFELVEITRGILRQWAIDASSSSSWGDSWHTISPLDATGHPDVGFCGDSAHAWSPLAKDDTEEWLELVYETPVNATSVSVYETLGSGFVRKVEMAGPMTDWVVVWTGTDATPCPGIFSMTLPSPTSFLVDRVRITTMSEYWEAVDAVLLEGLSPAPRTTATRLSDSTPSTAFVFTQRATLSGDRTGDRIYLWGGHLQNEYKGELKVFNVRSGEWVALESKSEGSPAGRVGSRSAFDDDRDRFVIFFGQSFDDDDSLVWAYDCVLESWTVVDDGVANNSEGPAPRHEPGFARDSSNDHRLYFYGGRGEEKQYFSDLWTYDLTTDSWNLLGQESETSPLGVWDPIFVYYDPMDGADERSTGAARSGFGSGSGSGGAQPLPLVGFLYLLGGYNAAERVLMDIVWVFDLESGEWAELSAVSPLDYGSALQSVSFRVDSDIFIISPLSSVQYPEYHVHLQDEIRVSVLSLNSMAWRLEPVFPAPRYGHSLTSFDMSLWMFAGRDNAYHCFDTLWKFSYDDTPSGAVAQPTWTEEAIQSATAPLPRAFHATAMMGTSLLVHGGECSGNYLADMWMVDLAGTGELQWVEVNFVATAAPSARAYHRITVLELQTTRIALYGGKSVLRVEGDVWMFDLASRTWAEIYSCSYSLTPPPRMLYASTYIESRARNHDTNDVGAETVAVLVFGGKNSDSSPLEDAWSHSLSVEEHTGCWHNLDVSEVETVGGIPVGFYASAAHAAYGETVIKIGGSDERVGETSLSPYISWIEPVINLTTGQASGLRSEIIGRLASGREHAASVANADMKVFLLGGSSPVVAYAPVPVVYNDVLVAALPSCFPQDMLNPETEATPSSFISETANEDDTCYPCVPGSHWLNVSQSQSQLQGPGARAPFVQRLLHPETPEFFSDPPRSPSMHSLSTSLSEGTCVPCEAGTVQPKRGKVTCIECPAGFVVETSGGNSFLQCSPCHSSTYREAGMLSCEPCPDSLYCPLASSKPISRDYATSTHTDFQPAELSVNTEEAYVATLHFITFNFLFFSVSLMAISLFWLDGPVVRIGLPMRSFVLQCVRSIDLFRQAHVDRPQLKAIRGEAYIVVRYATVLGGYFTIIYLATVITMWAGLLFPFSLDNDRETRSILPALTEFDAAQSRMELKAIMHGLTDCTIDDSTCSFPVSVTGFSDDGTSWCSVDEEGWCVLMWECSACDQVESTASVSFRMEKTIAAAHALEFMYSVSSGLPGQTSSVQGLFVSPLKFINDIGYMDSVFHGSDASVVRFQLLPTVYENQVNRTKDSGYHVSFANWEAGSTATADNYLLDNNIAFAFEFALLPSVYNIYRYPIQSVEQVVASMLGAAVGFVPLFTMVVKCCEYVKLVLIRKRMLVGVTSRFERVDVAPVTPHSKKNVLESGKSSSNLQLQRRASAIDIRSPRHRPSAPNIRVRGLSDSSSCPRGVPELDTNTTSSSSSHPSVSALQFSQSLPKSPMSPRRAAQRFALRKASADMHTSLIEGSMERSS